MKDISFRDNMAGRHGEVLRSSAIFYFLSDSNTKSTVSILNYWKFKRGIEVSILATLRNMAGEAVQKTSLVFENGNVINFSPFFESGFEGSVEIEVFSEMNMVIPYSAIVCCYETKKGFTVVHGYARAYSAKEQEEGRMLTNGKEGCWTLRDNEKVSSFCVIHNGFLDVAEQEVTISVINSANKKISETIKWPELKKYESRKIYPSEIFPGLTAFLGGQLGQAQFDFKLGAGFTRMLVGNQTKDKTDLQVTHSNFDYTNLPTDLTEEGMKGYMFVPQLQNLVKRVIVYPQMHAGHYQVSEDGETNEFTNGEVILLKKPRSKVLSFEKKDGLFPTRLVTALELEANVDVIPGECSLGVLTRLQPKKRLWWGVVTPSNKSRCFIVVHDLPEVFGNRPESITLHLTLYSSATTEVLTKSMQVDSLEAFENGLPISEIWSEAEEHLKGGFGYYTMFCEYGGLTVYSLMKNDMGSVCLEHGF
jgi:hypothetical protein